MLVVVGFFISTAMQRSRHIMSIPHILACHTWEFHPSLWLHAPV